MARNIAMQAEHQMQQQLASVNERLLDVTADVHRLHSIRESPEQELYRLRSESRCSGAASRRPRAPKLPNDE
jgi:hypothetical protein